MLPHALYSPVVDGTDSFKRAFRRALAAEYNDKYSGALASNNILVSNVHLGEIVAAPAARRTSRRLSAGVSLPYTISTHSLAEAQSLAALSVDLEEVVSATRSGYADAGSAAADLSMMLAESVAVATVELVSTVPPSSSPSSSPSAQEGGEEGGGDQEHAESSVLSDGMVVAGIVVGATIVVGAAILLFWSKRHPRHTNSNPGTLSNAYSQTTTHDGSAPTEKQQPPHKSDGTVVVVAASGDTVLAPPPQSVNV
jgi:hypothetical protein